MDEGYFRAQQKLNDALNDDPSLNYSSEDEEDPDAPCASNAITKQIYPPTPITFQIPGRFVPLLEEILKAEKGRRGIEPLYWYTIESALERKKMVPHQFNSAEEYLQCAKEIGFVEFSHNKRGEIEYVQTRMPHLPSLNIPAKSDDRKEVKNPFVLQYGSRNLTEEMVKATLHATREPDHPVPADMLFQDCNISGVSYLPWAVPLIKRRGLLLDWKDGWVLVQSCSPNKRNEILRNALEKQFPDPRKPRLNLDTLDRRIWLEDPNVFLACMTTNLREIVGIANKAGNYIILNGNGEEVTWIK